MLINPDNPFPSNLTFANQSNLMYYSIYDTHTYTPRIRNKDSPFAYNMIRKQQSRQMNAV